MPKEFGAYMKKMDYLVLEEPWRFHV